MARHTNSHNGRIDDKSDGDSRDAETVLINENKLASFVSVWKLSWMFCFETENNETGDFAILDVA